MSLFVIGTPSTNAKVIRNLVESFINIPNTGLSNCPSLFDHCSKELAFSTISAEDGERLVNVLLTILQSDVSESRSFSLRVISHISSAFPPSVLSYHWLIISQKVISLLKSGDHVSNPLPHAQALSTLASLLIAAAPLVILNGDMKALTSTIARSALVHAERSLEAHNVSTPLCMAALSVMFAALHTAPRELRALITRLESLLWEQLLDHHSDKIRLMSASLYAQIFACYADKLQQNIFFERIEKVCDELRGILLIIDVFSSSDEPPSKQLSNSFRSMSAFQLGRRYTSMCSVLKHMFMQHCDKHMPVPLPSVIDTLCKGIEQKEVDPYSTAGNSLLVDPDSVLSLVSVSFRISVETLAVVVEACGTATALPYTNIIGDSFKTRMSHMLLHCRKENASLSSISERIIIYNALWKVTNVLGSSFMDHVIGIFEALLSVDITLYKGILKTKDTQAMASKASQMENLRSQKRRRQNKAQRRNSAADASNGGTNTQEDMLSSLGPVAACAVDRALSAGLEVATIMFEDRGFLSKSVCMHLAKLETLLSSIMYDCELSPFILEALSAAAISGGSNRMVGEASPLFIPCSKLSRDVVRSCHVSSASRRAALSSRSGCESIIHPRGPPFLRTARTYVRTNDKDKVQAAVEQQPTAVEKQPKTQEKREQPTAPVDVDMSMATEPQIDKVSKDITANVHAKLPHGINSHPDEKLDSPSLDVDNAKSMLSEPIVSIRPTSENGPEEPTRSEQHRKGSAKPLPNIESKATPITDVEALKDGSSLSAIIGEGNLPVIEEPHESISYDQLNINERTGNPETDKDERTEDMQDNLPDRKETEVVPRGDEKKAIDEDVRDIVGKQSELQDEKELITSLCFEKPDEE